MKPILSLIVLLMAAVAKAEPYLLYKIDTPQTKYVLSRSYRTLSHGYVSEVILADNFSVHPTSVGCQVTFSNACVLRTKMGPITGSTNDVVQNKSSIDVLKMEFLNGTKVIFNNSIVEMADLKLEKPKQNR